MKREVRLANDELLEGIRVLFCGYHDCPGGYAYGPIVRDEYVIHFVREGWGRYQLNQLVFPVHEGSSFTLFPGVLLHYQADKVDPWRYYWVAFAGPSAKRLLERIGVTVLRPVVQHRRPVAVLRLFESMLRSASRRSLAGDLAVASCLYRLASLMASDAALPLDAADRQVRDPLDERVLRSISLIQENFRRPDFTVEEVANLVGLERSYFSKLFRMHTGTSPHAFLSRTRLEQACRMLESASAPIKRVAAACGFRDQNYFDKVFRGGTGLSPSMYRERLLTRQVRCREPVEPELPKSLFS